MNKELLLKYNRPGPRYTSYPPATFFSTDFKNEDYQECLINSNSQEPSKISLYVHIPFCVQLCYFCGCNTGLIRDKEFIERYINALIKEIKTVADLLDKNRKVTQVHWGGGSPNSIPLKHVDRVMNTISELFTFDEKAEIAMECSPSELELDDIDLLRKSGFNRLSLGIQDFNNNVLEIVNRLPSKHPVEELVSRMKKNNFEGVNLDLIYGLPGQNQKSFEESINKAIEISPDRLVTFSYAHVPWVKSAQKKLEKLHLPTPDDKLSMFISALSLLTTNGYEAIGMDHYAKPNDDLTLALKNKTLHRNFQGYCTKETTGQVYGFGSTSISQLNSAYIQNVKSTLGYIRAIEDNDFAVERGYKLTEVDMIRREVINEIMCNGLLSFDVIAENFNITPDRVKEITGYSQDKLKAFIDDNLLEISGNEIRIKNEGLLIVRNIAMAFDPLLKESKAQYSKTV